MARTLLLLVTPQARRRQSRRKQFISIVKYSGWIARRTNYTESRDTKPWSPQQIMSKTPGGKSGDAGSTHDHPALATRSLAINGNRIDSRALFAADREIMIAHGEEVYRLRLTSQNKLILTK